LPQPAAEGSKEARGRVLIIAGAVEMPGAAILASTAALRAGAGKVRVATAEAAAMSVATAVPELFVIGISETARDENLAAIVDSARTRMSCSSARDARRRAIRFCSQSSLQSRAFAL
jgi:NAD(P)H-hydrate repair Nnr-like enzyme with NAD(P)H-hydrate dehydratase domain